MEKQQTIKPAAEYSQPNTANNKYLVSFLQPYICIEENKIYQKKRRKKAQKNNIEEGAKKITEMYYKKKKIVKKKNIIRGNVYITNTQHQAKKHRKKGKRRRKKIRKCNEEISSFFHIYTVCFFGFVHKFVILGGSQKFTIEFLECWHSSCTIPFSCYIMWDEK